MKTTFIVTSAIETNLGPLSPDIRILQTLDTVKSVRTAFPDAIVVLVEGGERVPTGQLWDRLRQSCNVFIDMTKNEQIQHLQQNIINKVQNKFEMGGASGLAKSVAELTLMASVLDAINNHPDMVPARQVDRIFKISGRYQLSPLFDPAVYADKSMKYVFKKADKSWIPDAMETIGTDHSYNSRLWSFDIGLLDQTHAKFVEMIDDMIEISTDRYIDVEHLLYKHIGPKQSVEIDNTHLFGTLGPNVMVIYD